MNKGLIKTLVVILVGVAAIVVVGYFQRFFPPPEPKKVSVIVPTIPVTELQRSGFLDKMAELGYAEGRNITYMKEEFLPPEQEKFRAAFRGAIENDFDVIYTMASAPTLFAYDETQKAGSSLPIVFGVGDLGIAEAGAVIDLGVPGRNVTGVMSDMPQTIGRSLEFLRVISPEAQRVGVLTDGFVVPVGIGKFFLQGLKDSAARLGFTLVEYKTAIPPGPALEAEAKKILEGIQPGDADAWVHPPGHFVQPQQFFEAAMGRRIGIPTLMPVPDEVAPATGGFMAYGE